MNLSMAIVCMVKPVEHNLTISNAHSRCVALVEDDPASAGYNGTLDWSPAMQSMSLSATFYGALATILFSGFLADKFGAKNILLLTTLVYSTVTMLTPMLVNISFEAFFVFRILMGVAEGFFFPSIGSLASKWFAPSERSTAAAIYTSGNQVGAATSGLVAAQLCNSSFGWPSIFYFYGFIGISWCIAWSILFTSSPSSNRWINDSERIFLENNGAAFGKKTPKVPWVALVGSKALWAAIICQYAFNFQASAMQSFLPMFLKDQLGLSISENGLYTMVPFLTQLIAKNIFGPLADHIKRRQTLTKTACVKVFQSAGSVGSSICLLVVAYFASCETKELTLAALALYGVFFSAGICGFFTSILSIAPNYGGSLISISMFLGMLGNIRKSGKIQTSYTEYKWEILLTGCAVVNYLLSPRSNLQSSADEESWNKPQEEKPKEILAAG
ncbi:unnamed protein product [Caenorhabditis auriculariae]|uniref:Major facilitator superfamily (MFS) profile domain-containing protein n=1 Tax=Caenorhabditis auriculariae TaxID=2777116 RepID=A0A8S1H234_9PELO|nr:unnamed protein product [Caenorhabditis auriculariae]